MQTRVLWTPYQYCCCARYPAFSCHAQTHCRTVSLLWTWPRMGWVKLLQSCLQRPVNVHDPLATCIQN